MSYKTFSLKHKFLWIKLWKGTTLLCISLKISAQLKKECWKLNFTFNVIEDQIKKLILRKKKLWDWLLELQDWRIRHAIHIQIILTFVCNLIINMDSIVIYYQKKFIIKIPLITFFVDVIRQIKPCNPCVPSFLASTSLLYNFLHKFYLFFFGFQHFLSCLVK